MLELGSYVPLDHNVGNRSRLKSEITEANQAPGGMSTGHTLLELFYHCFGLTWA
jgi:hypothetical protein